MSIFKRLFFSAMLASLAITSLSAHAANKKTINLSCDVPKGICTASGTDGSGNPISGWVSFFTAIPGPGNGNKLKQAKPEKKPMKLGDTPNTFTDQLACDLDAGYGVMWHVGVLIGPGTESVLPSAVVSINCDGP